MIVTVILAIVFFLIDQVSKLLVVNLLEINHSMMVIKDFFYLTYTNNMGAAFSILTGKRIFLIVVAVFVLVVLFNYLKKNKIKGLERLAFSLVIGGAIGNLFDRVIRGYVVDFFDVKIFGYDFPIFNVADSFIVVGVFLLMIVLGRGEKNDNRE